MKALVVIATLCFCELVGAQTDTSTIASIRHRVQEINLSKDYETKELMNDEFLEQMTDRGGMLTALMRDGELVKMIEHVGLSSCLNIAEYYFNDSQLVFVSIQGSEFAYVDSTASFDEGALKVTMEARFYFHENHLVKSDLRGSTRCGGAPTKEWASDYQAEATRLKALLMR